MLYVYENERDRKEIRTCVAVINSLKPRNPCLLESAIAQTLYKDKKNFKKLSEHFRWAK